MKYSYTRHYKYKLEETEKRRIYFEGVAFSSRYVSMDDAGLLVVHAGYAWDGSSVPYKKLFKVLSLGIYDADKYCKPASLIHDALCQAMREGLLPKVWKRSADQLYHIMCIKGGMSRRQARRRYEVLRKFGDVGIKPEKNPRNKVFED